MLQVDNEKLLCEIGSLKSKLVGYDRQAQAQVDLLSGITDEVREQIKTILIKEYASETQKLYDYLMIFVKEVPEEPIENETTV